MSRNFDNLDREMKRIDPVGPDELGGERQDRAADELLDRILATDPGGETRPLPRRRRTRRAATLSLAPLAAAAVLLLVVLFHSSGGPAEAGGAAAALDGAAAVAAAEPQMAAETTYTFLKTREVTLERGSDGERSWAVDYPTVREEWVAGDGSGRIRTVSGPGRFGDARGRLEWEAAGQPDFLPLGLDRRTEDRWLAAGLLAADLAELPTTPRALAGHLHREAAAESGTMPISAAMLQLIAVDLRNPGASPELRQALFAATKWVPGIRYLGPTSDPSGRDGVAVGVLDPRGDGSTVYSLIFDPESATVLASETRSGGSGGGSPRLEQAMIYLDAHPVEPGSDFGKAWLSAYDSSAPWQRSSAAYTIYRVPSRDPWLRNLDDIGGTG